MKRLPVWLLIAAAGPAITGCIDKGYDLANVDSTVRIAVNDLVIPISLDAITLGTVLDLDDASSDATVRVIDGAYAVVVNGQFTSDPIAINPVVLSEQMPQQFSVNLSTPSSATVVGVAYPIVSPLYVSSSYKASNVSTSIQSVSWLGLNWTFGLRIQVGGASAISSMELRDLQVQFPKGLTGVPSTGSYDATTGLISIASLPLSGGEATITFVATGLNVATSGLVYDASARTMTLDSQVGIAEGSLVPLAVTAGAKPEGLSLNCSTQVGALTVNAFSGILDYAISGFALPDVSLSSLPDLLNQSSTNLSLLNPQLYFSITNPIALYGATDLETGLTMTPVRDGVAATPCTPDGGTVTIVTSASTGQGAVVLSPTAPTTLYPGYSSASFTRFTSLPDLLSGAGLPSSIRIEADNAEVHSAVAGLVLGSLGRVEGDYTFYAPLQFAAGSAIVYSGDDSGWHSDELEYLTIETMTVTADVTSTLPLDVDVTVVPLDEMGQPIDAVVEGAHIAAGASDATFTVKLTGQVCNLDGIRYEARASAPAATTVLTPTQELRFSNIRICVGGYYQKEL